MVYMITSRLKRKSSEGKKVKYLPRTVFSSDMAVIRSSTNVRHTGAEKMITMTASHMFHVKNSFSIIRSFGEIGASPLPVHLSRPKAIFFFLSFANSNDKITEHSVDSFPDRE